MMTASDVIESYVVDVAAQLPRAQRADVAAELRSLLHEEIGLSATADEAVTRVRAFGKPSDVASRYHAPYAVIEPTDTRSFVLVAVVGALLIPPTNQRLPLSIDQNAASMLFLSWLGTLVILFALKSWAARRWPGHFQWKPSKVRDYDAVRFVEQLPLIAILLFYELAYLMPGPVVGLLSGGNVPRGVLNYTADFASPIRMLWFALVVPALVVLEAIVIVQGRWSRLTRTVEIMLFLLAGTQLGWHASYGDIFVNAQAEHSARITFQLLSAAFMLTAVYKIYREWGRIPPAAKIGTAVAQ
jgi:hypothetical protein